MKHTMIPSLLSGAALLMVPANAAVIASDDFSSGVPGSGVGWATSSTWGDGSKVSGGAYTGSGSTYRDLATPIVADTDFWVVFDVTITNTGQWGGVSFYNGTSERLHLVKDSGHSTYGIDGGPITDTYSTIPIVANVAETVLYHVEGSTNTVSMWVDPNFASLGAADASVTDTDVLPQITRIRLGSGAIQTIDNLIIGNTLADVPEPSSVALLGLGGLALLRRRRN